MGICGDEVFESRNIGIMKAQKYCHLEPVFPVKAYLVMAYMEEGSRHIFYPLEYVFTSRSTAIAEIKLLHENLKTKGVRVDAAVVYEIHLDRKLGLSKECWEGKDKEKESFWRYRRFIKMMSQPGLHEVLILPQKWEAPKKNWKLAVSIPFYRGEDEELIYRFIKYSRDVVDIRSKSAAIYTIGKAYRFWRETGELKPTKLLTEPNGDAN